MGGAKCDRLWLRDASQDMQHLGLRFRQQGCLESLTRLSRRYCCASCPISGCGRDGGPFEATRPTFSPRSYWSTEEERTPDPGLNLILLLVAMSFTFHLPTTEDSSDRRRVDECALRLTSKHTIHSGLSCPLTTTGKRLEMSGEQQLQRISTNFPELPAYQAFPETDRHPRKRSRRNSSAI